MVKNSSLFRKFFISYIFILILPLITGIISYYVSISFAESSSITNSLSILNQSKMVLDEKVTEVGNFAKQLAMNTDVIQLLQSGNSDDNSRVFRSKTVSQNLLSFATTNDFLQDTYLYIKHDGTVITPNSVFYRLNYFYELNNYQHISFEEWKRNILEMNQDGKVVSLESSTGGIHNIIAYVHSLPLNSFGTPLGTIVVQIDDKKVNSLLDSIIKEYGGWALVTDKNGQVLAKNGIDNTEISKLNILNNSQDGKQIHYLNNKTLLISSRSNVNGWYYLAGIPQTSLMKNANIIKIVSWIVTITTLLIGLLISLWFALKNSVPIHSLVMSLREHLDPSEKNLKDDYNFLQGNISSLLLKNKLLQNELSQKLPILKEMVIYRLLHGDFYSSSEIEVAIKETGLKMQDRGFISILRVHGYDQIDSLEIYNELNVVDLLIKQRLDQMDLNVYVTNSRSGQLILLFTMRHQSGEGMMKKIEDQLEKLCFALNREYHITFTIALGSYFNSLSDAGQSFNHAKQVMDYLMLTHNKGIFWYEQMPKQTNMYEYTIEQELRLMNAMKTGDPSQAKQILEQIFEQNFNQKMLTIDMVHQVINEIKSTLLKTFSYHVEGESSKIKQLKKQINEIQLDEGLEQVREVFEQAINQFCNLVLTHKSNVDNEIVQTIIDYFNECFGNPNLSVCHVVENIGRPEKFISQLFKNQTGKSLMEYLEKIRINKASELLINSDSTIEVISYQVGYNSPHSFRRAFKRIINLTPNQFRKAVEKQSIMMNEDKGIQ